MQLVATMSEAHARVPMLKPDAQLTLGRSRGCFGCFLVGGVGEDGGLLVVLVVLVGVLVVFLPYG